MPDKLTQDANGKVTPDSFGLGSAFRCAFAGICAAARERNFRIELCFAVTAAALGLAFGITTLEWLVVVVCIGMVLAFECVNTAVEAVVDLASPEWNALAKVAKDAAAGAALIVSIASFIVGVVLFAPRILSVMGIL